MREVSDRQAMAAELISDGCNIWQTFDSCRQLIALCMGMDQHGAAPDGAEMGMFRVLGIVTDALEHLEGEVRVLLKAGKDEAQSSDVGGAVNALDSRKLCLHGYEVCEQCAHAFGRDEFLHPDDERRRQS